jgi:hypothetical protein
MNAHRVLETHNAGARTQQVKPGLALARDRRGTAALSGRLMIVT